MITSADLVKLLRRTGTIDPLDVQELSAQIGPKVPSGFLYSLGRVLDYPGRVVRRGITGMAEPTGRDVLQKLGLLGRNKPGFDVGDVLGVGTEFVLDPFTWITGVGAATKAGKALGRIKWLTGEQAALKKVGDVARNVAEKEMLASLRGESKAKIAKLLGELPEGATKKLAPTWAEQARAVVPQRALLSMFGQPVIRGAPVLGALQQLGGKLAERPSIQYLRSLVQTKTPEQLKPILAVTGMLGKRGMLRTAEEKARLQQVLPELVRQSGIPKDEWQQLFARGRESLEIPEKLGPRWAELKLGQPQAAARATEALEALSPEALAEAERMGGRLKGLAGEEIATGARAAHNLLRSKTIAYLERVKTPEARRWLRESGNESRRYWAADIECLHPCLAIGYKGTIPHDRNLAAISRRIICTDNCRVLHISNVHHLNARIP